MFRVVNVVIFAIVLWSMKLEALERQPKILHISLHAGCIKDIEEVARALSLDVSPWLIQRDRSRLEYDGEERLSNDIYNITPERAEKIWNLNKDYFDQFDVIITSDTAPLARIFIQNGWKKPLIIWICNRFDYADAETAQGRFPDPEYYELFQNAAKMPNVRIISYTRYEHVYARRKGVEVGIFTINPVGRMPVAFDESKSAIPANVDKGTHLFLYPRLENRAEVEMVLSACEAVGIKAYHGTYNGPEDLTGFKGVLYFPYAWSNLALFEDLQQGIVHFVPSKHFIKNLNGRMRVLTTTELELCDWWSPELSDYFVYFDSFEDLKHKVETTNYKELREKVRQAGLAHRTEMLGRWRKVFDEVLN